MITKNTLSQTSAHEIFRTCFPSLPLPLEVFGELLGYDECTFFVYNVNDATVGFTAVKDDCIRLLCVLPDYRRKGVATALLSESESYIKDNGYEKAILGGFGSQLFIGAVTERSDWDRHDNPFFRKRGYAAENGCIEMSLNLHEYDNERLAPTYPDDVKIGFYDGDINELLKSVALVDNEWVQYFGHGERVMTAIQNGQPVSFAIVDDDDTNLLSEDNLRIGSVGCVGTVPQARKKGIGLAVVAAATDYLRAQGCDKSFIHFTYLEDWYGRLGYKTFLRFWFGNKTL